MNRVIKFRAWDKEENKMINNVVPFFNSDGKLECLVFGYSFGGYDFIEVELDKYQHIFTDSEFEKRYVLMQYTGLKDKNGVEIFEGDIVEINHPFSQRYHLGEVFYDGYQFSVKGFWFPHYDLPNDAFSEGIGYTEVIGNIYENPELLEVES